MNRIQLVLIYVVSSLTCFSQSNTWTVTGNDIYNSNSGNVGIGTNNPQYKLDVLGNVRISNNLSVGGGIITSPTVNATGEINGGNINISGNLQISSLSGSGNTPLFTDNNGNIFKQAPTINWSCWPTILNWNPGGNSFNALSTTFNPPPSDIGTCDGFDFMLKSNNIRRQWIKPDGTIGFGTNIGSNTNGPEYRFKTGVIRLQNTNTYGGPQIIFDFDNSSTPFGDWGIEYTKALTKNGLNFWKPFGSTNSNNNLFFIADDGMVGVGTDNPTYRLTVDAWSGDGFQIRTNNNKKAISCFDKTTNVENFAIQGNGKTQVGTVYTSPTSLLTITGANPDNAIEIHNSANSNNLAFLIKGDGSTVIKSTNSTSSLDIIDATNAINFRVKSNGFVYAREVEVTTANFPDYVFKSDYKLISLEELEIFINKNRHLPGFKNADYYIENGIKTSEIIVMQQEKLEELTLYIIELKKKIDEIEKRIK